MTNLTICFLVVNQIQLLPRIAINSALTRTKANIVVGYVDLIDIEGLPEHQRIKYLKINDSFKARERYQSYENKQFFEIVQLKWSLFSILQKSSETDYNCYLDLDVIVINDFEETFIQLFTKDTKTHFLIQDDSVRPDQPQLCMGVVGFKKSKIANRSIGHCAKIHKYRGEKEFRIGDDEVVTEYYKQNPGIFKLLPQSTFPTGRLLSAFLNNSNFVGIKVEDPFVFHANYLVGDRKKSLVLIEIAKKFNFNYRNLGLDFRSYVSLRLEIFARKVNCRLNRR